jgi:hypothetical protein
MPTKNKRETALIKLFVSAYQNGAWKASRLEVPDEKIDGGVDGFIKRDSDGRRLAIEHTLIQPNANDRQDFALFEQKLLPLERDTSLAIPGRITRIYVRSGTLKPGSNFDLIAGALHDWLSQNVKSFPLGRSSLKCPINGSTDEAISLFVRVYGDPTFPGTFKIRRFHEGYTLGEVVEKALSDKLPKLIQTVAEERILLLEREQMMLDELSICKEIGAQRSKFTGLTEVGIWFAETVFYASDQAVDFTHYENEEVIQSLQFFKGRLISKSEEGVVTIVERI